MPTYDENPTPEAVLKRTRDRITTVRAALIALASSGMRDGNQRARQASKNLEMLVDRKEMRQVKELSASADELDVRLAELKVDCERLIIRQTIEPERRERLSRAIKSFLSSPVASGAFIGGARKIPTSLDPPSTSARSLSHAVSPVRPTSAPAVLPTSTGPDSFELVLKDEALCKAAATCPSLTVRSRFHEPNVCTLATWQSTDRFYLEGIDRRVVFVCESPSKTPGPPSPDFLVEGVGGYRCWSGYNARNTDRFTDLRRLHGFENCFITNAVKCGVQAGKPDNEDIARCAGFLFRELSLVQPAVIACVGKATRNMVDESMRHWPGLLASQPSVTYLTHYSAASRGMPVNELSRRWKQEVDGIKAELRRRGLPDDRPVFLPMPIGAGS